MFPLGQVVSTPGAMKLAEEKQINLIDLVRRHQSGDWGALCKEDKQANVDALKFGSRIFSSYEVDDRGGRIYVITEHDRSSTCCMLPVEY